MRAVIQSQECAAAVVPTTSRSCASSLAIWTSSACSLAMRAFSATLSVVILANWRCIMVFSLPMLCVYGFLAAEPLSSSAARFRLVSALGWTIL